MSLFIDTTQGAGIAAGTGIRPFLPPLLVGALARADAGIDFDGTDYSFLEKPGFLFGVLALALIAYFASRTRAADSPPEGGRTSLERILLFLAVVLGALLCAGSVEHGGGEGWVGLLIGAGCAGLGWLAASTLFGRAARRLDPEAARMLPIFADLAALAVAGLSIAFGPLAIVFVLAFAYLVVTGRRRAGEKYAGLRVLNK